MAPGSDLSQLARNIGFINFGLLVFNLFMAIPAAVVAARRVAVSRGRQAATSAA